MNLICLKIISIAIMLLVLLIFGLPFYLVHIPNSIYYFSVTYGIIHAIIFGLMVLLVLWCYFKVLFTDPGYIKLNK